MAKGFKKVKQAPTIQQLQRQMMVTMLSEENISIEELRDYLQHRNEFKYAEAKEKNILEKAEDLVYGEREVEYGKPKKNLQDIANMWNAYFEAIKIRAGVMFIGLPTTEKENHTFEINAQDAAVMMLLMKTARIAKFQDTKDTLIDIAGYAAVVERIQKGD